MYRCFGALLLVVVGALPARADFALTLDGLPGSYTAGSTFSFDVKLTGATQLAGYDVTLILTSDSGVAGTDFFFSPLSDDLSDIADSAQRYVFEDDGFGRTATISQGVTPDRTQINLSDLLAASGASVTTIAGQNDTIARITIGTTSLFTGTLKLYFDDFLLLDDPDGQAIPNFGDLAVSPSSGSPAMISPATTAIPEPTTLVMLATGLTFAPLLRLRHRRASTALRAA